MVTDQIADMLTRIRNAITAQRRTVTIPASRLKNEIARILAENHFISKYAFVDAPGQKVIKILLRYDKRMRNAIRGIQRVSAPGRRVYVSATALPRVLNGMGIAIVSTSQGVMTDQECRRRKTGGEVVCKVW